MMPTCWIIKNFDGVQKFSGDIKEILTANRGVVFDEALNVFYAFWSKEDDPAIDDPNNFILKSYVYSDTGLVELLEE